MSNNNANTNIQKLHPIYVALDSHQYHKAIKLCQQQQSQSLMAKALLAHAYMKNGQRFPSLATLQSLLCGDDDSSISSTRKSGFRELQLEVQLYERREQQQQQHQSNTSSSASTTAATTSTAATAKSSAKGKKGKKRGSIQAQQPTTTAANNTPGNSSNDSTTTMDWDLVDMLDTPTQNNKVELLLLSEDDDDDNNNNGDNSTDAIICNPPAALAEDETLLQTVALTLRNAKLPLTVYQLFRWIATTGTTQQQSSTTATTGILLAKAFLAGCFVLVHPKYESIVLKVLAQMQVLALQLAKYQPLAAAWAAQAALWQVEYSNINTKQQQRVLQTTTTRNGNDKSSTDPRLALLPRLATLLASKCLALPTAAAGAGGSMDDDHLVQTEHFLLYLRTLDLEEKWQEKLDAIQERLLMSSSSGTSASTANITTATTSTAAVVVLCNPPRSTLLDLQAQTMQQLGQYEAARLVLQELLQGQPDSWSYWKRHLECCLAENKQLEEDSTEAFVDTILKSRKREEEENSQRYYYPLRGPLLVRVQAAADGVRKAINDNDITAHQQQFALLLQRIQEYSHAFAASSSCAYSDLCPYLQLVIDHETTTTTTANEKTCRELLEWLRDLLRAEPSSTDPKTRRSELRAYIFAVQMNYKILSYNNKDCYGGLPKKDWMPRWPDLLRVWKSFQDFDPVTDQDQKENRPADELILLAVQQLLASDDEPVTDSTLLTAASILEAGISYSPYNAHLKISAMFVYSELHATTRSWELFQQIFVKHIQYESCSYLILPLLRSGGMYLETISICKEIIRLQRVSVHDSGEYSGRAMEHGSLSKADEFLHFHWKRINKSLTTLEAKGLILDAAPLFVPDESKQGTLVGAAHGIVGGPSDCERAKEIISEAHDPFAAFSLLRLRGNPRVIAEGLSENRDFSVLSHGILRREFDSPEKIVRDSLRRGHQHGLLIRAALCVEMTKGPKKGKLVPPSDTLRKRCSSMLASIDAALVDCGEPSVPGYNHLLRVVLIECRVLAAVSTGLVAASSAPENDSLETREEAASSLLAEVSKELSKAQNELAPFDVRSIHRVCLMLPECIVPMFAVFEMCAEVLDLYGWGRRKRKTKRCAAALADVSVAFTSLVDAMIGSLNCLSDRTVESNEYRDAIVPELVDEITYEQTTSYVCHFQQVTKDRVSNVLTEIRGRLASFDIQD